MSSEGSVSTSSSSRMRQFGLYRTIDARTEEFLRLSRKRQLKQGCACAAISTAITVTVVITIFFVYMEYGTKTEANQQLIGKAGWIGLLNKSLASSFEEKFSKSKIYFDRSTIKLLPILIKALKQNRYLEKFLDDYSSPSPASDGKMTTEFSFKKDLFLNTKNRMKKTFSRLYTIEYKTSPIVFLKHPTREPGYFTKNRKIREYKRIMAYVEKMINDKVGIGSIVPMTKTEAQTENIAKSRISSKPKSMVIHDKNCKTSKKTPNVSKQKKKETISCKCPKNLSIILDKIISGIQRLLPDDTIKNTKLCGGEQKNSAPKPDSADKLILDQKFILRATTTPTILTSNAKVLTVTKHPSKTPVTTSEFDHILEKEETTLPFRRPESTHSIQSKYFNSISPLHRNKLDSSTTHLYDSVYHFQTTTAYDQIEPTERDHNTTTTTQPVPSKFDILEKEIERDEKDKAFNTENKFAPISEELNTLQTDYINQYYNLEKVSANTNLSSYSLENRTHTEKKHSDNITKSTTDIVIQVMNQMNSYSLELLRSRLLPSTKRSNSSVKYSVSSVIKQDYATTESTTKNTNSISSTFKTSFNDHNITFSTTERSTDDIIFDSTEKPIIFISRPYGYPFQKHTYEETRTSKTRKFNIKHKVPSISMNKTSMTNKSEKNILYQNKNLGPFYLGLDNNTLDDEEGLNLKRTDTISTTSKTNADKSKDFSHGYDSNERIFTPKSMIPHDRPTYLEIHRNTWKPDENKDYDTDLKYNIFDLL